MGLSEKSQVDDDQGVLDSENRKWVITLRAPPILLKPIYTIPVEKEEELEEGDMEEECSSTTPKGVEARIPPMLTCPPAPRKRKSSLKCKYHGREFFTPPELDTVFFIRHVERAS